MGHPVVDIEVTLTDGKFHAVDSSEMSFKMAGGIALREAMANAGPVLLEPLSRLNVTMPIAQQGDVMGDLNARRGRVQTTDSSADGSRGHDHRGGAHRGAAALRDRPALNHRRPRHLHHRARPLRHRPAESSQTRRCVAAALLRHLLQIFGVLGIVFDVVAEDGAVWAVDEDHAALGGRVVR